MTLSVAAGITALKRPAAAELRVTAEDMRAALQVVQPSAMREVALEISKVLCHRCYYCNVVIIVMINNNNNNITKRYFGVAIFRRL